MSHRKTSDRYNYRLLNFWIFFSSRLVFQHSHLESIKLTPARADLWFRLHGLFDALFRFLIPFFIRFYPIDIIYLFPTAIFTGIIFLTLIYGLLNTALTPVAILPIVREYRHGIG